MPTVIDSFVVELGLDPKNFSRGANQMLTELRKIEEQGRRGGNEIEAQSKRLFDLLSGMRRGALIGLGAFFGFEGFKQALGYITTLDAATSRFAQTAGMATSEVSAWQGAFKQVGGSAESANGALDGLNGELTRFQLTGQSSILPVLTRLGVSLYDQNHNLKTAAQLWLELAQAVEGMDPRQAAAFLRMIPGANQDLINLALMGRKAMETLIQASRDAGVTTKESAEAARQYQQALAQLEQSATNLGRTLTTTAVPAIVSFFDAIIGGLRRALDITGGKSLWDYLFSLPTVELAPNGPADILRKWFSGKSSLQDLWDGLKGTDWSGGGSANTTPAQKGAREAVTAGAGGAGPSEMEAYIRQQAASRGINPDVAVAVARSEGLFSYVGDQGTSFGPYQLHYKNNVPGLSNAGLGDVFTRQTGLDAQDPSTWRKQVEFSLDRAKTHGWRDWHGWKGAAFAGIGAPGAAAAAAQGRGGGGAASTTNVTVTVGGVTVNAPQAKDADGIAKEIGPALQRSISAGAANYGQQ